MKIIDCFPFFQELDIINLRLKLLEDYVDTFIISELDETHSGNKKKYLFKENLELFRMYSEKISIIEGKTSDMDEEDLKKSENHGVILELQTDIEFEKKRKEIWSREIYQRNIIYDKLNTLNLDDEDIIILSDVDEIPDPKFLNKIRNNDFDMKNNILILEQDMYIYSLRYYYQKWLGGTRVISWGNLKRSKLTLDDLRVFTSKFNINIITLPKAGWHLSYFGDYSAILKKYQSYTHSNDPGQKYYSDKKVSDDEKIKDIKFRFSRMLENKELTFIENPENTFGLQRYHKFFSVL